MKKLNEAEEAAMKQTEEQAKALGLETMARSISEEKYTLNEDNYMKFNLPDSAAKFKSGNGEGVWGIPLMKCDRDTYNDNSTSGVKFNVIILNDALTYPFKWGTIIKVETRGDSRPVVNYDWLDSVIKQSSDGRMSLEKMLEK